ncbi:MAG: hypothetical protein II567_10600, partial [Candidatus Riflebacteria bacterium]|nr:hypothetical protein [Candidatus Riflebacteria bacterium]
LVNSVGSESSSSAPPNDYGYITNCYGGVTSENFSGKTWSSGAWSDYDAVSASSWPPDLSENRRPTQP